MTRKIYERHFKDTILCPNCDSELKLKGYQEADGNKTYNASGGYYCSNCAGWWVMEGENLIFYEDFNFDR